MRVLDLFSGLDGWGGPWRERGHDVFSVDWEPQFQPDLCIDVMDLRRKHLPWATVDAVLASPPCEAFSVASIGRHWSGGRRQYVPKTPWATQSMRLVSRTVRIVQIVQAPVWIVENPRGVLRKLGIMPEVPPWYHTTQWYCHWGEDRAKPTDLWYGGLDVKWRRECHNRRAGHREGCCCYDHVAAPRGSRTGTQGPMTAAEKSLIPRELSLVVCRGAERSIQPHPQDEFVRRLPMDDND